MPMPDLAGHRSAFRPIDCDLRKADLRKDHHRQAGEARRLEMARLRSAATPIAATHEGFSG